MPRSWGSGDVGQEGQMGRRAHGGNTCSAPPEQLPHLARTEVTMAGQQTLPERLCNDRNNSSYSLPDEKKLRMDRTGKCPVSLQACPNQNENKHLLTVQNGMLSCQAQAAPPLAPNLGLFCRSLCLSWSCAHRKTWATSSCSRRSCATWWESRTLCPGRGRLYYSLLSLRQHLVKAGAGFRLDPPLGFILQNQRRLHKWWGKWHIRGICGRNGVQHTPTVPHWVLLPKQEARSTFSFHKGEAKHLLLNPGILMLGYS